MGKEAAGKFSIEVFEKLGLFIATAFGLVAAFAWREAFVKIFETYYGKDPALAGLLIYALVVSIVGIIATILLAKAASRVKKFDKSGSKDEHKILR